MSNITVTNLPVLTSLSGTAQLMVVQNGVSSSATAQQVANLNANGGTVTSITAVAPLSGGTITSSGSIGLNTNSISNTYLSTMPANTIKGNNSGSAAQPQDLTVAQTMTLLGAAPLASPAFTGVPTAPTAATSDSSTQIATTAFVKSQSYGTGTVTSITAGTGLSGGTITSSGTIAIANTGVNAQNYGSASAVPQLTVNAQGQITSAINVNISITPSQVSGLGTMATQNANAVAITGGTINQTTIGGTTPAAGSFTNLSASGNSTFGTVISGNWNGSPIPVAYGGTAATTASAARGNLGAAASGANSDITSLSGLTTPLSETQGGTGYGSYTTGDLLYASSSSTLARLNDVATGNALISGGVGVAPTYGKIGLTTHVTGALPIANGGTGQTTASAAFNALSPITSTGDLIIGTGTNTASRLAIGTSGYVLTSNGTTALWQAVTPLGVNSISFGTTGLTPSTASTGNVVVAGTLNVANGGTGATTLTGYLVGNGTSAVTAVATIPNAGLTNSSITIGSTAISLGASTATLAGLTTVTVTQDPTAALQLSTKQYVDGQVATVSNTTYHTASAASATANLNATYNNGTGGVGATLTNAGTQAAFATDGYTASLNDRILVQFQTSALQNGIYTVTTLGSGSTNWVLTRATDFNTVGTGPNFIETGAATFVTNGTIYGATSWVMNTTGTITVGTTALTWAQISASGNVTVSAPITKTGSTIGLGTVTVPFGGTGLTSLTAYGLLYAPTTSSVGQISPSTTGYALLSTGASSAPAFGQVSLTAGVTGTLPTANGGTGLTTFTAANNAIYSTSSSVLTAGTLPIAAGGTGITSLGTGVQTALGQNVTGSGGIVLANSPTLVTPALGTPSALVLTNATGLPLSTGVTGSLGVANGGTGTTTAFTTGSIVFAGASGVYSQNNSKFFWDNTNNRLGINTNTPQTQLTVVSNTQTTTPSGALPAGTDVYIVGANNANTRITQDGYGTGAYGVYTGRSARGTAASPTASQSGDILSQFTGRGYGATGFATASTGRFDVVAAENWTDTAQGTYASVFTTVTGGNSPTEAFRFGPAGQLGIGGGTYGTTGQFFLSGGASAAPTWTTVTLATLSGVVPVASGGTGLTSYTVGDLIYASGTTTLSKLSDVATGAVLVSGGVGNAPSYSATPTVTSITAGSVSVSGNQTFTGSGSRFLGDFSNAAFANRLAFQTSTVNGTTGIYALPNGTATAASWQATNNSDPTNASKIIIATNGSTDVQLVSGINGTGTYLPLSFFTNGVGQFAINTSGAFGIGSVPSATVNYGTSGQVFTSSGPSAQPTWSSISGVAVTSINFGTTGLTPATATTGAVTVAGTLNIANGGTGLTTTPANGALDIGNGTGFTRTTLTAGTGISITNGAGSITINATGGASASQSFVYFVGQL